MTGHDAKCKMQLPEAAPGLLATPQPGLELRLSFFVSDFCYLPIPPTLHFFFPNSILLNALESLPLWPCEGLQRPVLSSCPHFTSRSHPCSLVNPMLKCSLPETGSCFSQPASLVHELRMKFPLWQSDKAAFGKALRLWAALQLSSGHRAGPASAFSATPARLQPPEEERRRLDAQIQIHQPTAGWPETHLWYAFFPSTVTKLHKFHNLNSYSPASSPSPAPKLQPSVWSGLL